MSHTFGKSQIALASFGAFIAILPLSYVALNTESLMLLGSFGASALLLFALPEAPLSQPRSVICGHLIASAIALACLLLLGKTWWAIGAATGLGVGLMMLTRTIHPPAGSNAIIVFLASPSWDFLMMSTLGGTVLLVSVAYCYHKTTRHHRYPQYWIAPRTPIALPDPQGNQPVKQVNEQK